jgi:glycerol kinase
MEKFIGAIDQGTTSTRFIIFDAHGGIIANESKEHRQIMPNEGYIEHDLVEIWSNTEELIASALRVAGIIGENLAAIGIANQRETTAVWNMYDIAAIVF